MMKKLQKPNKRFVTLLGFLISFILLCGVIIFIPPHTSFALGFLSIPILLLFFPLITVSLFFLLTLISQKPLFGILISVLISIYLLFRLNGLTHPFFLFLLIALLVTFLLFLKKER